MNDIYIKHKASREKCLRFNEVTGPIDEVDSQAEENLHSRALYTGFSGGYIGVLGSKTGPRLFINNDFFEFSDPSWEVKVEKLEDRHVFYLYQHGALLIKEDYIPPPILAWDPWSDEESDDLYMWLAAERNCKEIAEMWTLT